MGFTHQKRRNSFWGPQALAVISCALALLAAQPLMAQGPVASKPVLLRESGSLAGGILGESTVSRAVETTNGRSRREESFLASARRLHVLATVEIFQRLLMAELRTGEQHVLPGLFLQPVCVEVLAPASSLPAKRGFSSILVPEVAQIFAIEHCLLAPPMS